MTRLISFRFPDHLPAAHDLNSRIETGELLIFRRDTSHYAFCFVEWEEASDFYSDLVEMADAVFECLYSEADEDPRCRGNWGPSRYGGY